MLSLSLSRRNITFSCPYVALPTAPKILPLRDDANYIINSIPVRSPATERTTATPLACSLTFYAPETKMT